MTLFDTTALLVSLAAIFGYLNYRFVRLPTTIGLMLFSLLLSLVLVLGDLMGWNWGRDAARIVEGIDFNQTLMQGMLSFLLFAGALHLNLEDLMQHKWTIGVLATLGVAMSTLLVGGLMAVVLEWTGTPLPLIYCFVLGAIVSPTDPIAVMSLLKQAKAPRALETKIAGESLFNDGVGIVLFLVLYQISMDQQSFRFPDAAGLLLREAAGGTLLGLALGWVTYSLLKTIDNYQIEVLLTLAFVTGGYSLASSLHLSGPLAVVAGGLLIGNQGRHFAMTDTTRRHLDTFWELVDEILNAILFVLIGLEILVLTFRLDFLLAGALTIPVVLLARLISVGIPVSLFRLRKEFSPHVVKILTWGGLRGGISVALALSLPAGPQRELILILTYGVVVFSILVQGLTLPTLLRKMLPPEVSAD